MKRHTLGYRIKCFFWAFDELLNPFLKDEWMDGELEWKQPASWKSRKIGFFTNMNTFINGYIVGEGCIENNKVQYIITGVQRADEIPSIWNWFKSLLKGEGKKY